MDACLWWLISVPWYNLRNLLIKTKLNFSFNLRRFWWWCNLCSYLSFIFMFERENILAGNIAVYWKKTQLLWDRGKFLCFLSPRVDFIQYLEVVHITWNESLTIMTTKNDIFHTYGTTSIKSLGSVKPGKLIFNWKVSYNVCRSSHSFHSWYFLKKTISFSSWQAVTSASLMSCRAFRKG